MGKTKRHQKPFAGVDGEGGDIEVDGVKSHQYLLLRAGDFTYEEDDGSPLKTEKILRFLCMLPRDKEYVSYFFDYDVTMILRTLPAERLVRLLDQNCRRVPGKPCNTYPVNWGRYQIEYMPRKEFKVRRCEVMRTADGAELKWGPWLMISDTGSFFQSSFVKTLKNWFGTEKDGVWVAETPSIGQTIAKIEEGKLQRAEFGAVTEEERAYNHMECEMLSLLMERYREMCTRNDIYPNKFQGPGNLVSAVMRRVRLPRNIELDIWERLPEFVRMANAAYYGGRFETAQFGSIPGPVFQYDINSAYADTYRHLPCLVHGAWHRTRDMPDKGQLYVGHVSFRHRKGLTFCTLPVRGKKDGVLLFPEQASGIYWSPELDVARDYAQVWWKDGYVYEKNCECNTFDWVYEIYEERKRMGKDAAGKVLKLVLASTYGKLAQSVGCAPYSNPIWAGLIVANVRATLIAATLQNGNGGSDVCMLATDGIFCREPRDLPLGGELGQWSEVVHPDMFTVQSGIYFINGQKPKTRGTPQTQVQKMEPEFRAKWKQYVETGKMESVSVSVHTFHGLAIAMARNKQEIAGTWSDEEKEISFDWASKRMFDDIDQDGVLKTMPISGSAQLASDPYSRTIGGIRIEERLLFAAQPEWAQQL